MKIRISRNARELAQALLTSMVITSILSMSVMGYLTVVEQQNFLSTRSQAWNVGIAIVEAGVEEALQQLNSNTANLAADGWTPDGQTYTRSRNLGDGNSYTVTIYMTNSIYPVIISRATMAPPELFQRTLFAAVNVQTTPARITRAVMVKCYKSDLFTAALVVKHGIDLNGNGVYSDSYDSSNPAKSTGGKYDSSRYSGDRGDIATNGGITDSVSVQNANIYGVVHTGPNCPVLIGSQGGVGPHGNQVNDIPTAIARGYIVQDANFTFPDTTFPNTSSYLPPSGPADVVTYSNWVTAGSITVSNFPAPPPSGGVTTNVIGLTSDMLPNPLPPGLTTNYYWATNVALPNPLPAGLQTNTASTTSQTYPVAGTYLGTISSNFVSSSTKADRGWWYTYNLIVGYRWPMPRYAWPTYTYTYSAFSTNVTYFTNHYDRVLYANNKYVASSLTGKTLVAGPNVTLALPNGLSGAENIVWETGASVTIYCKTRANIAGNTYINPNGAASSLVVLCDPSVTSFAFSGNGQFTGVFVAPSADLAMNGGGNSNTDFCGSLLCNSIQMNGHFSFHWDESLSSMTGPGRFLIRSWDEIP